VKLGGHPLHSEHSVVPSSSTTVRPVEDPGDGQAWAGEMSFLLFAALRRVLYSELRVPRVDGRGCKLGSICGCGHTHDAVRSVASSPMCAGYSEGSSRG
jgi:hypothetical protein